MGYKLLIKNTYPANKSAAKKAKWRRFGGTFKTKTSVKRFRTRTIPRGLYLTRIVKKWR